MSDLPLVSFPLLLFDDRLLFDDGLFFDNRTLFDDGLLFNDGLLSHRLFFDALLIDDRLPLDIKLYEGSFSKTKNIQCLKMLVHSIIVVALQLLSLFFR
ncbi:unnamed protein product [Mycena citricolor]|uniref:Uncharacterized protein n=1 Tax=Mycena citricolor TaxID=2018698 RepID=A0AAD2HUV9_9AGAR|nr:unnamed protein product [Mycena citricolor]